MQLLVFGDGEQPDGGLDAAERQQAVQRCAVAAVAADHGSQRLRQGGQCPFLGEQQRGQLVQGGRRLLAARGRLQAKAGGEVPAVVGAARRVVQEGPQQRDHLAYGVLGRSRTGEVI